MTAKRQNQRVRRQRPRPDALSIQRRKLAVDITLLLSITAAIVAFAYYGWR